MDDKLEVWLAHAKTYKRSALVGISLGVSGAEIYNKFDELSDDDFEDVVALLFVLFSGRPGWDTDRRLAMMDAAWRHARMAVALEGMPAAGEA